MTASLVLVRQESSFTHQLLMHECAMLQKVCHEKLQRRWGQAPRTRFTGSDFKPPISCFGQKPRWWALWEKARQWLRQVCVRELNETEPVLTYRKRKDAIKIRFVVLTWEESGRDPVYWPDGDRYRAGRNLAQAFLWNLGTCSLMLRENSKRWTRKDESIDAMCRGGTIRSSDVRQEKLY